MTQQLKIIVERHVDGYVAYPLGLPAVIVGEGDTYEDALADVRSAIDFYFKHYANEHALPEPPLEVFITETTLEVA